MEDNFIKKMDELVDEKINEQTKMNRAQRRAQEKKTKQKRDRKIFLDNFSETAKKMVYVRMIERLREKRKEIEEQERNEATED